jgi:hypothetical protein
MRNKARLGVCQCSYISHHTHYPSHTIRVGGLLPPIPLKRVTKGQLIAVAIQQSWLGIAVQRIDGWWTGVLRKLTSGMIQGLNMTRHILVLVRWRFIKPRYY